MLRQRLVRRRVAQAPWVASNKGSGKLTLSSDLAPNATVDVIEPGQTNGYTCTASFVKKTYPVSAVAGTGGTVSASTGLSGCPNATCSVEHGGSAVLSATPSTGFEFSGWSGCSIGASGTVANVTSAQTCTATSR